MSAVIQLLVNGLLIGMVYALAATGLSLVLGVMRLVNLAHGAFYTLGAFLAYTMYQWYGVSPLLALPLSFTLTFLLSFPIAKFLVTPLRKSVVAVMVVTLGLALLLEQIYIMIWGPFYLTLPSPPPILGISKFIVNQQELLAASIGSLIILALWITLKTRWGLAVRTIAQDEEIASLAGVNVEFIQSIIFGLGGALAATAGTLLAPLQPIYPSMGWPILIITLAVVIAGGMGSLVGALVAGLAMGLAGSFIGFYLAPQWTYIGSLLIIVLFMLYRPRGIFGRRVERE